jgi:hypothetical protein
MATVTTYDSEAALQAGIGGTVTTYKDESALNAYLATITTETLYVVAKGGRMYTVCTNPTGVFLSGVANPIVAKGAKYTVIFSV